MGRGERIDEAFRQRRAALEQQELMLQAKRDLGATRQTVLDEVRVRVLDEALDRIAEAFARNGCPAEPGNTNMAEAGSRAGGERRFSIPGQAPGQSETMSVSAVAAFADPTADSLRITAQVAERRAQSEAFGIRQFQDEAGREALQASLREWLYEALEGLVVERLGRRGR